MINERIHNPHFIEFQRQRGTQTRDLADIPCGGLPTVFEIRRVLRESSLTIPEKDRVYNILRVVMHIEQVEQLRFTPRDGEMTNRRLRVRYMLNDLSDSAFRKELQKHQKSRAKKLAIGMVLNMIVNTMSDYLRQFTLRPERSSIDDMTAIVDYANTAMTGVACEYDCVVPFISKESWGVVGARTPMP